MRFNIIPLASAKSGELTTLIYRCEELNKSGIILGFYGDYWNESEVVYQGYSFKNLDKENAFLFLNRIVKAINDNSDFLKKDTDNNNVSFEFEDMKILIYRNDGTYNLRVFWNGFDSTWENIAFKKNIYNTSNAYKTLS